MYKLDKQEVFGVVVMLIAVGLMILLWAMGPKWQHQDTAAGILVCFIVVAIIRAAIFELGELADDFEPDQVDAQKPKFPELP